MPPDGNNATSSDGPPIVMTDRGEVQGALVGGAFAFKGIPYAAPPVGDLRWRPPVPAAPWSGVRDATQWGARCIQLFDVGDVEGSEDCLFLNVWTPATAPTQPLPVLVFMHGGSNVWGASSDTWNGVDVYDGGYAAAHGPAVVISINYRLAAMGFLGLPAFSSENEHQSSGNYGLLDQQAALAWVQRNASAFGGDPARVMLFGQSAGAVDTCAQMASPLAQGLFSRALLMSGSCGSFSNADAAYFAGKVAHRLGCDTAPDVAACLRGKTGDEVTRATGFYEIIGGGFFGPSVDGWVLPHDPASTIAGGFYDHVPLVVGTTSDEMSQFIWSFFATAPTTEAEYRADVQQYYGAWTDRLLAAYPTAKYGSQMAALEALFADDSFLCPSRDLVRDASKAQTEPVRRYVFTHAFENPKLTADGAAHGYDVFFALHNLGGAEILPSNAELALGDTMLGYWVRFAATGDPNGDGAPAWPTWNATDHQHLVLDEQQTLGNDDRTTECDLWDALYAGN
jgi:para-nitrobenzyl esterase